MRRENPYRAAGTFAGPSYVAREADRLLLEAIHKNKRYPYIVAPRQSGKSSLLVRTQTALDPTKYLSAFVDLSIFNVGDYDDFWRCLLEEIATATGLDPARINPRRPEDILLAWLDRSPVRLVVFIDEIDTLIGAAFCDQFFSKLRSLFNKRAERADKPAYQRLVLVLAGAAHPARLIKDHMRSPFNVGLEIKLDDLTRARVGELVSHLADSGATVDNDVAKRLQARTGGSVYLSQLLLEKLWEVGEEHAAITSDDVEAAIAALVAGAGSVIHFSNIYALIANNARLLAALGALGEGRPIESRSAQDLRLSGISNGVTPFRNDVYSHVFGAGGPLDLVKLMPKRKAPLLELTDANEGGDEGHRIAIAPPQPARGFEPAFSTAAPDAPSPLFGSITAPGAKELTARIGTTIGQRYALRALLGEGGMAAVYLADDVTLGKRVALKLLKAEHATDPQVLARFDREAKAMTLLVHEHIVPALGFGRSPEGDMCLVMELVEGETLRSALKRIKPFPPYGVVEIANQIAAGLACAHGFGVVHRDFKPENVMISWLPGNRPWIKILDFGMARLLVGSTGTPLTRKGAIFGTPEYMPPEQAMGQPVDARADQYAFGVMVFEMLAGQRPFKAKSATKVVQMQIRMAPPSLTDLVPGLPPAAAAVVVRMLAKHPDDRFPDVQAAATALSQALASTAAIPQKSAPYPVLASSSVASDQVLADLEQAKERREALDRAGLPTHGVDSEIQTLRRDLRKGGQLHAGDSLGNDRYLLLDRIGRGGFASVWKARDQQERRDVAIKILHPNFADDEVRQRRFVESANLMASLYHPRIARIFQRLQEEDGFYYFVMEFVAGGNLRQAVLEQRIGAEEALALVLRLGEVLEYVHARGIVHRDVKPANVLLTADGEPKLTDFDITAFEETSTGTVTGALGTIVYAAPEILDHTESVDARVDVYGLGMTAIFCLKGKELPIAIVRDVEPILKDLLCKDAVKRVLARAVNWDRAERFEDAASFCEALRAASI